MNIKELEEWRPVKNYEGLYEVSSLGRVRSLDRVVMRNGGPLPQKGRLMKPYPNNRGYLYIFLANSGKYERAYMHRLVAEAFIPNPENLPEVNHRDECKTNNAVWNLEWCNHKYNINYGSCREKIAKTLRLKSQVGVEPSQQQAYY